MTLPSLYQLPNGDWIDLLTIASIRYMPYEIGEYRHKDRVRVDWHTKDWSDSALLEFDTAEAAIAFRDELAARANEARKQGGPS